MAQGIVDRTTGRRGNPSTYDDQSYAQQQSTVTGPRTDVSTVSGQDRAFQNVSSYQSARNTTPTVLNILDQYIQQLFGSPAVPGATKADAEREIPLLVKESVGGIPPGQFSPGYKATTLYRDPRTGRTFQEAEGLAENEARLKDREALVKQGGKAAVQAGTPEQRQQQQERQREIERNRAAQSAYSKEAAFTDAQSLVNKSIADALEKALPAIYAASEGAGTSKSSMAALLAQRAAERGATEGAALGAQTAVAYGGLQNQLAGVLEMLTRSDPNSPANMLLQAIAASKGLVQEQSGSQDSSGVTQKQQQGVTEVGPQEVMANVLKEVLQPLQQLNSITQTNPRPASVATPRGNALSSGNVVMEAPQYEDDALNQQYASYISPTEVSVYSAEE